MDDTDFIHVDLNDEQRVSAWQLGGQGSDNLVVVVAFLLTVAIFFAILYHQVTLLIPARFMFSG